MDFKDLNRVSPKDDFSLPHINVFIDNVIKSYIYTSMDNFLRYNKKMSKENREKTTSFITLLRAFYYKVMSFDLKNVGATYDDNSLSRYDA